MERPVNASDLRDGQIAQREAARAKELERREIVANVLQDRYPAVADKIRSGMRYSTYPECLIDPGLMLDLLEKVQP